MSGNPQSVAYKESRIPWVGKIPEHWEVRKIKQVARIVTGKTPSEESNHEWGSDLMFITPTDCLVEKKYVSSSTRKLSQEGIKKFASIIVPKDSVLVSCIASIGKVSVNSENALTNQQINTVIPNKNFSSTDFLYYQLLIAMPFVEKYFCGYSTLPIINKGDFSNVPIVLPPLEEQKAIANFLDKKTRQIEEFITKKQKLITLLEEKKQTLINQCVTQGLDSSTSLKDSGVEWLGQIPTHWGKRKIKHIASTNIGLVYSPNEITENGVNTTGILRSNNIQEGKINYLNLIYIDSEKVGKKQIASIGDLLMCVRNGSEDLVGKTAKITQDNFSFGAFMAVIRSPYNDYLYWIFQTNLLRKSIANFSVSIGIGQISQEDIKNFVFPFPPLEEQKAIAEYLDTQIEKIDLAICKIKSQINLIKEYKTTLISEAVCGRVGID